MPPAKPIRRVAATALSTPHFLLLYGAMLVAAAGNTALQSVMPAIGREIGIADFWVAIAYTWSALLWVMLAPYWAEKSNRHGRKLLTLMGLAGFIVSMLLCGLALNRLIPEHGPLMSRIHFAGHALFIPFFLLSVGMLVDVRAFADTEAWTVIAVLVGATVFSKAIAAKVEVDPSKPRSIVTIRGLGYKFDTPAPRS